MQKSTRSIAALASILLITAVSIGCGTAEQVAGEVLSSDTMILTEVTSNEKFQQMQAQLARSGDELVIEQASLNRLESGFAVIIPIKDANSEYSSLVYQRLSNQAVSVTLELSGNISIGSVTRSPLAECAGWGPWGTTGSRCSWHIMCLGDATILDRRRCRTCWNRGGTYSDCENTSVRNRCGC